MTLLEYQNFQNRNSKHTSLREGECSGKKRQKVTQWGVGAAKKVMSLTQDFLCPFFLEPISVIHLMYVVKCFPSNIVILITTRNHTNFISYISFSQFWQIFVSS